MNNLFRVGTVSKTHAKDGKMVVDIDLQGAELYDVPVRSIANRFVRLFIPVLVGEQVFVFAEDGDLDKAYATASLFNLDTPEPEGGREDCVVLEIGGNRFEIERESVVCHAQSFKIFGDVDIAGGLHVEEDISTDGGVSDALGDLTNFTTTDGAERAS